MNYFKKWLLFSLLFIISIPVSAFPIDKIIAFGDSLSDNGNFYNYTWKWFPDKPYYEGRFSNGPTWVEDLAQTMQVPLLDCAYGGAVARTDRNDVAWQLNNYIDHAATDRERAQHLYVLWVGGNDYLPGKGEPQAETDKTISAIESHLETLITKIHAHTILVLSLPDLSRTPLANLVGAEYTAKISEMVHLHNAKLVTLVQKMQAKYPFIQFVYFDITTSFNDVLDHPARYGVHNVKDACYQGDTFMYSALSGQKQQDDKSLCDDAETRLFWDHVHPTKLVHSIIASEVSKILH